MIDDQISTVLVRLADRYEPGPPPTDELLHEAGRRRHRRSLLTVAAAVALTVVVIGAASALSGGIGNPSDTGPATPPAHVIPPDSRLVGVGHAAIAVPKAWPFNKTGCGTPVEDTVIINVSVVPLCLIPRPPGVTAVDVQQRPRRPSYPDFTEADAIEIDGSQAYRTEADCSYAVCTQAVWIPDESALFTVTAPDTEATEHLLDTVQVLDDRVAVPQSNLVGHTGPILRRFTASAEALGFQVDIRSEPAPRPSFSPGSILSTSPPTGAMRPIGSTIRVTIAR